MPPRNGASARLSAGPGLNRLVPLFFAILILPALLQGPVRAEPPTAVTHFSADEAGAANATVVLLRHPTEGGLLIEAGIPPGLVGATLLAVAPEAGSVALAAPRGAAGFGLILAAADGSQLRVQMPGLRSASFAPAGDRLLAIDQAGALWQVAVDSGEPRQLAAGPFAGRPLAGPDGAILLLSISSLEAPIDSVVVRLDPDTQELQPVANSELVYGVFPLADGALAVVAHEAGHTVVRKVDGTREHRVAALPSGAVNVVVAADGTIAFERDGTVFVAAANGSSPHPLIAGEHPSFSPDGSVIGVLADGGLTLVTRDGRVLDHVGEQVGFAACPAGCPS